MEDLILSHKSAVGTAVLTVSFYYLYSYTITEIEHPNHQLIT